MLFPFASWEHPWWRSGLLQHATAQSSLFLFQIVRHQKREGWLFFRGRTSDDEAAFVVTAPVASRFVDSPMELASFADPSVEQLRADVSNALSGGQFARLFFLDGNEELRRFDERASFLVVVSAAGWAQWHRVNVGKTLQADSMLIESSSAFCWTGEPDSARFLVTPALELWSQLQRQKEDSRSDCAFARRVLGLSSEEMGELLIRWNKGTKAELKQVLGAALLSQAQLWQQATGNDWIIDLDLLHTNWHRGRIAALHPGVRPFYSPAPGLLRGILRRVEAYFEPAYNEDLLAAHLEAALWRRNFQERLSIRIENPSAHERLEAALFWRDWQNLHPPRS
jgi:hypothetical protein